MIKGENKVCRAKGLQVVLVRSETLNLASTVCLRHHKLSLLTEPHPRKVFIVPCRRRPSSFSQTKEPDQPTRFAAGLANLTGLPRRAQAAAGEFGMFE